MSKTYDKIRNYQNRRNNACSQPQEAAVKTEFQDGYKRLNLNIFASQSGKRTMILFALALGFILWQNWSFNKAIRESQADHIQVTKRLNEQDKMLNDANIKISGLEAQLKDSQAELETVKNKLKASEEKTASLEKQLEEQKTTISNLKSANQQLLDQLEAKNK